MASTDEPNEEGVVSPVEPETRRHGRLGRIRALRHRFFQLLRDKRGLLALLVLVAGFGSVATIGGVASLKYTETVGFCSRCHTMTPEVRAYEPSVHRDVPCAECHVKPGIGGWIAAKKNGSKQMIQMITGKYPRPIPPPDHSKLPNVKDTCLRCHSLSELTKVGNPMKIVFRPRFRKDRSNTREMVAVVVRPAGLGKKTNARGAHWHVEQQVEFTSPDENSRKINSIRVKYKNGTSKQFIARSKIGISVDVRDDLARLRRTETTRRMDCIECHNRVGHDIPTPNRAIDDSMEAGKIDTDLPFIKRLGLSRVSANYPSEEAADQAIAGIRKSYAKKYPRVLKKRRRAVTKAIDELQLIYRLVATPEMKARAVTYPNNLGHQSSPGCFRCHDGEHYRVVKGEIVNEKIPSSCATCHTFPQVGKLVSSVSVFGEPSGDKAALGDVNRTKTVSESGPTEKELAAAAASTKTPPLKHGEMLFRHPTEIVTSGLKSCAYCHQPVSCARCHRNPMLGSKKAYVHRKSTRLRN